MNDLLEIAKNESYLNDKDSIEFYKNEIQYEKKVLSKIKNHKRREQIDMHLKRLFPYLLSAGVVYAAFAQRGQYPFLQEEHPVYNEYIYLFSSNGYHDKIDYSKLKEKDKDLVDTISYYEPWQENEDHTFSQKKTIYSIAQKEKEHLLAYYDNPANCNYQDFMKRFKSSHVDDSPYLSEEERNTGDYYKTFIYSKEHDSDDFEKETPSDNMIDTILYLLACSGLFWGIGSYRKKHKIDFKRDFKDLNDFYDFEISEVQEQISTLKKTLRKKELDFIKKYH